MAAWARLLVILPLVLAGCFGSGDEPAAPADPPPPPPPAPVEAPCESAGPQQVEFTAHSQLPSDHEIPSTASLGAATLPPHGEVVVLADPLREELRVVGRCEPDCHTFTVPHDAEAPLRTTVADVDGDGHQDIVVADIGELYPSNAEVGAVRLLLGDDAGDYRPTTVIEGIRRVACAEPGDLDGDGDLDLTLCEFGDEDGSVGWLAQEDGDWEHHVLDPRSGAIHAFPVDVDGDGDLDVVAVLSQEHEELLLFRNDGAGRFTREVLFDGPPHHGLSGVEPTDLDRDGDMDLLVTHGDTMDMDLPDGTDPHAFYGLSLFVNDGAGRFSERDVMRLWGAYGVRAADLDGDCDLDLALVAWQVQPRFPEAPVRNAVWLEHDGELGFTAHDLPGANQPVAIEVADVDGDGDLDLLTGTLYMNGEEFGDRLLLLRNDRTDAAPDPPEPAR